MPSVPVLIAHLMLHELEPRLKRAGLPWEQSPVEPWLLAEFAQFKAMGVLSTRDIRGYLDGAFRALP